MRQAVATVSRDAKCDSREIFAIKSTSSSAVLYRSFFSSRISRTRVGSSY